LNALGRLLAVGSEWAGYATLVPQAGRARRRGQLPTKQTSTSADRAHGKPNLP